MKILVLLITSMALVTVGCGKKKQKSGNLSSVSSSGNLSFDEDGDGFCKYGYQGRSQCDNFVVDCDDNLKSINSAINYYIDSDGDGFGTSSGVSKLLCQEQPPAGYSVFDTDPDDSDPASTALDFDGDGVLNELDCAVRDGSIWDLKPLYVDSDGDGFTLQLQNVCVGTVTPAKYRPTSLGIDCNDGDPNVYSFSSLYVDFDGDAYGDKIERVCVGISSSYSVPLGYMTTTLGPDCKDTDPNVFNLVATYTDKDQDGYIVSNAIVNRCIGDQSVPAQKLQGAILVSDKKGLGDCDENDPTVWRQATIYYDVDGDKYPGPIASNCTGANVPSGFVALVDVADPNMLSDCNDKDPSIWRKWSGYLDSDEDGYVDGDNTIKDFCLDNSTNPKLIEPRAVKGYNDCAPHDPSIFKLKTFWADADDDEYTEELAPLCAGNSTPLSLFSSKLNGSDCNDDNGLVHNYQNYYADPDGDGRGDFRDVTSYCAVGSLPGVTTNSDGDNCPKVSNSNQLDSDQNGIGDLCDDPNSAVPVHLSTTSGSNVGLSAVYDGSATGYTFLASSYGISTGKHYFEAKLDLPIGVNFLNTGTNVGVLTRNSLNNGLVGTIVEASGTLSNPAIGSFLGGILPDTMEDGDVIGVSIDFDLFRLRIFLNGAEVQERVLAPNLTLFVGVSVAGNSNQYNSDRWTLNFGQSPFQLRIPIGYLPFDRSSSRQNL